MYPKADVESTYTSENYVEGVRKSLKMEHFQKFASKDNGSLFGEIFHSLESTFSAAKKFPIEMMKIMFTDWDKVSMLRPLPISKFDETTKDGATLFIFEFLCNIGALKENKGDGSIAFVSENIRNWQRRIFGCDYLTNQNVSSVMEWVMHQQSDVNNEDFAKTIQEAISQITFISGEFHMELHMMAVVYMFSYGGFLQPLETLINWKGIWKDPSAAYKKNCE
jgi:hypothetical protein